MPACIDELPGHPPPQVSTDACSAALHPDGSHVVTGSRRGQLSSWLVKARGQPGQLSCEQEPAQDALQLETSHGEAVDCVRFAAGGEGGGGCGCEGVGWGARLLCGRESCRLPASWPSSSCDGLRSVAASGSRGRAAALEQGSGIQGWLSEVRGDKTGCFPARRRAAAEQVGGGAHELLQLAAAAAAVKLAGAWVQQGRRCQPRRQEQLRAHT
jgi:hypothetical protein